ncbi:MAG: phosphoenolpyruvate--protein phosphotransferase [Lachnospiraceae bacterium]|nr:phosphoenolpyruvate--protein phosphotransferase [Lachnospiraceae bacterium]
MISMQGTGVSPGVASGTLHFYHAANADVRRIVVSDRDAEWERFLTAQAAAVEQLGVLAEEVRQKSGDDAAALLEGHQLLAEDPDLTDGVEALIREQGLCAEAAVMDAGKALAEEFAALDDPYLKERSADIKDVSGRIVSCLNGGSGTAALPGPVILAAEDLAPSETVQLDKDLLLGLVTAGGSASGHTAIMARTMGIPAVIGAADILDPALEGKEVFIDGDTGTVIVEPDPETRAELLTKQEEQRKHAQLLKTLQGQPSVTLDGQAVRVCCNIAGPQDVPAVLDNDGEGVGLFRSEFLYLGREDYPDEETQFEAYREVLSALSDREIIIRTLDIGADKQIGYFDLPKEENPALGKRALRICLDRPELFRTQLRAMYRASAYGRLGIMFPMVASEWEVREACVMCEKVQHELKEEGIPFSDEVKIGIMVETPAAAVMSDRLVQLVDFFSIGTNDLTQYTLACDRQNRSLGRFCDTHHPAVLRLIRLVAENAHRHGVLVSICGELAADLSLTETFLAMGIDELSVSPRSVLPLRQKVRETDVSACRSALLEALD